MSGTTAAGFAERLEGVKVRCGRCGRTCDRVTFDPAEGVYSERAVHEPDRNPPHGGPIHTDGSPGRLAYRCHPKRCGAHYPLRAETLRRAVERGAAAGRGEVVLGVDT